ncbi:MAG: excinuclease ABC subunit UvrC, partial [Candidatus Sungbacteria bacterium]|nr:excinuclease ABC subunit UvrC [Candidatus Sungbacteria bacterium]
EQATGSTAVFIDGQPSKNQYRKFKIKTIEGISDVDMIKEVLARRLRHTEWPYPQLLVIDGGKAQLNAAIATLRELRVKNRELRTTMVTALAKREEILYLPGCKAVALKSQPPDVLHLFQRIRDESHRFARAYHHKLRGKTFLQK